MFSLIFDYPTWYLLLCFIVALGFSALLYWKNTRDDLSAALKITLSFVRFIAVFIICFLLLSPIFERTADFVEEPVILFVQDNSESVKNVDYADEGFLADYMSNIESMISDLNSEFTVNEFVFGESFRRLDSLDFSDQVTDIANVFSEINNLFSNRNIGAIILASDGIYNQGLNPLYKAAESQFPVYTVALGDTTVRRDVLINRINHNEITYSGNIFPVEVTIEARKSEGLDSEIIIEKDEEVVFNKNISFSSEHDFITELIQLEAENTGMQKYDVFVKPVEGETNLENNSQSFFIDVIDSKQKVLILADSPHPDIGAVKLSLEDNENYEVDFSLINEFEGSIDAYNLIILHQLPSGRFPNHPHIRTVVDSDISALFIIGANTRLGAFNNLDLGLNIRQRGRQYNDAQAIVNTGFTLFSKSNEINTMAPIMPPLKTPFANYTTTGADQSFLYQKIGNVETNDPLITFTNVNEKKYGFICGEGIWRWRLNNYLRNNNHYFFNEIVSRIVQYLSIQEDKSFFRVNTSNIIYENEPVVFEAELYNASYELVNDPVVNLRLTDEDNVDFNYEFARTSNAYTLNAGILPPGNYEYRAYTLFNNEEYEIEGKISIAPLNLEAINTVADHGLLYSIASETDGRMFYPGELAELADHVINRDDIAGIMYSHKEYSELVNWKWLFFIILILLSSEWFMRKRAGNY